MSMIPHRRREDRLPYRLWVWLRRALTALGVMVVVLGVVSVFSLARLSEATQVKTSNAMLLTYALDAELTEVAEPPSLRNPRLVAGDTLHDVIDALTLAKDDARIKGLVLRLDGLSLTLAQVQELRTALIAFRQAGKFATIYAADYGGMGSGGMADYYLASAFSDIWLQPVGGAALPGLAFQVPFVKSLLDKIGVQAEMIQKGDYKSAPESLTATSMSTPARDNLTAVLDSVTAQVVGDIAVARGLSEDAVRAALQTGLFSGEAAVQAKLVDRIGYLDESLADAKKRAGQQKIVEGKGGTPLLGYLNLRRDELKADQSNGMLAQLKAKILGGQDDAAAAKSDPRTIALITASGEIVDDSVASAMAGNLVTPEAMRRAFTAARRNGDVAAIVLRIDSPGGSAFASETVRRLVMRARAAGTPVVVSMSGVAASGGYWIASAADQIVAQPATLTGSIGVFGGKIVIADTLTRIGVSVETLKSGPRADIWSPLRVMTADERAVLDGRMQDTYDAFVARVAEGRKMTPDAVEALAGGQVFSGQQAKQNGLVDQLGGLDVAVKAASALAGLAADAQVNVVAFPAERTPIERLFAVLSGERVMLPFKPETWLARTQASALSPIGALR